MGELQTQGPTGGQLAPTMGRLQKVAYTHEAMVDLIITESAKPGGISQKEIAAHFGYTEAWISNILASDAFQNALATRREELVDPELRATLKERFQALAIQSLKVLQNKLNQVTVSDQVALRCAELGAKALGMGIQAPPPPNDANDRLARLAERLVGLQSNIRERSINGEVQLIEVSKADEQQG